MNSSFFPQTPWLLPEEHRGVVQNLLRFGLIKFSNKRDLRLKKGGETDIYINLRDARNDPRALEWLASLYALALRRLALDQFVEVPHSVSCFAGLLARETGLPYLTIRDEEKVGRAYNARVIGTPVYGNRVVIIDDVITDGESKVEPYFQCIRMGLEVLGLVVLVDRQQGWKEHLASRDLRTMVWPGMTLHDVRRQLIELGVMERCDLEMEKKNRIILALDGKSWEEVLPVIDELRPTGTILKVNDLLFGKGAESLLPNLSVYGRVMVDPKFHDIQTTVKNGCTWLRACPPWAVTVHGSGGEEMIQAAVRALAGTPTKVLVVTLLTSIDPDTCEEIYHCRPPRQVASLMRIGHKAGAHGFVCSALEAKAGRKKYPEMLVVTPGVRSAGAALGDQKRVTTPAEALEAGADYAIMGSQILNSPNPACELQRVSTEELNMVL